MINNPESTPVIIGIGQINDRPDTPDTGLDSLQLMIAALHRAEADIGGGAPGTVLAQLDSLAIVDQVSFRHLGNLCGPLATAIGAEPAINYQSAAPHGDTPIRLLNEAANNIGSGKIKLAVVVGAEALRTAMQRVKAAAAAKASANGTAQHPNAMRDLTNAAKPNYAQNHGLAAPVDIYPLYENAARASYRQSLVEGQAESGQIWADMSQIAAQNDGAWIRQPVRAQEVITPSADNRPIAFPYNKLMVANSSVNQGAAFIIASVAQARRLGVAEDRMIYVGMGAAAKEHGNILKRDRYDRSASMDVAIKRAMALNNLTVDDLDMVELYSCFPCVPKMARRTLGWPLDKPMTVFGGLTFGGGPIANYMSHAVVAMVERLRLQGRYGLLFANGGFATDNHAMVLSSHPLEAANFPQNFDYQAEADAARHAIPELDKDYVGAATIETYTVFYARDGAPKSGVVVAKTPMGNRTLAHIDGDDPVMIAFLTDGQIEPVGDLGVITIQDHQAGDDDGPIRFFRRA